MTLELGAWIVEIEFLLARTLRAVSLAASKKYDMINPPVLSSPYYWETRSGLPPCSTFGYTWVSVGLEAVSWGVGATLLVASIHRRALPVRLVLRLRGAAELLGGAADAERRA